MTRFKFKNNVNVYYPKGGYIITPDSLMFYDTDNKEEIVFLKKHAMVEEIKNESQKEEEKLIRK